MASDMKTQVELHLKTCEDCNRIYRMQILTDKVINMEKGNEPDPFLVTRVMAKIQSIESPGFKTESIILRVLKPAFITVSVAAAVFFGVIIGRISHNAGIYEKIPVELALIDDATMESVIILSND
jgi:hypothetical protein